MRAKWDILDRLRGAAAAILTLERATQCYARQTALALAPAEYVNATPASAEVLISMKPTASTKTIASKFHALHTPLRAVETHHEPARAIQATQGRSHLTAL